MEAYNLFNQNFSVTQSLLQLYELFNGLKKTQINDNNLRLALCSFWEAPENAAIHPALNDRVMVLARSSNPIPELLTMDGGLDFLLRQAVIAACTTVESFFWDALRENVLTIVKARKTGADEMLRKITFTLGDYVSLQQYEDPDYRLQQIILNNFKRGTLYSAERIEEITKVMTITKFWDQVEQIAGTPAKDIKRLVGDLINRRNQITHRADRPESDEEANEHGLRPISLAWTNQRVQTAKTLVSASAQLIEQRMNKLKSDIQAAEEQQESKANQVLEEISKQVDQS
ncbi:outer membrane murein-binding lipoprotein Lpp [Desulfosalsimonas propionicica]|uniref:Outer membrane murein-binding lipoprotein Lpp n=1 Tax=Desulfosalsimonas propionicica TaxID=332175 RepID=A0A7W0HLZ5_9BACT|nr:HEPN domain-containing protein [Desulfosalsimonas propionicica]MBA2882813.1 outer membrane murein-binding lipoprotein Lpp [Desulfosalsimonas propionicica]